MKNKPIFARVIFTVPRILLGGIFIYASIDKIAFPAEFARIVENYELLPFDLIKPVAIILPVLELMLGAFLIVGKFTKPSAIALTSLLIIFIIVVGIRAGKGPLEECGCFDKSSILATSNITHIFLRDSILIGLGITTFALSNKS